MNLVKRGSSLEKQRSLVVGHRYSKRREESRERGGLAGPPFSAMHAFSLQEPAIESLVPPGSMPVPA
jgi:hypothetical protein